MCVEVSVFASKTEKGSEGIKPVPWGLFSMSGRCWSRQSGTADRAVSCVMWTYTHARMHAGAVNSSFALFMKCCHYLLFYTLHHPVARKKLCISVCVSVCVHVDPTQACVLIHKMRKNVIKDRWRSRYDT